MGTRGSVKLRLFIEQSFAVNAAIRFSSFADIQSSLLSGISLNICHTRVLMLTMLSRQILSRESCVHEAFGRLIKRHSNFHESNSRQITLINTLNARPLISSFDDCTSDLLQLIIICCSIFCLLRPTHRAVCAKLRICDYICGQQQSRTLCFDMRCK